MSDDFGTLNVRRGDRAREIEVMRQHYRQHREALVRMIADAPTENLAEEYQRLVGSIDASLAKLDELEARPGDSGPRVNTLPGDRALVAPPRVANADAAAGEYDTVPPVNGASSLPRVGLIIVAGLLVLGAIAWLILRASGERRAPRPITETTITQPVTEGGSDTAATMTPVTPLPSAGEAALKVTPAVADYGTIRKGTRAVRQFEATNTSSSPITITVARSQCRCLYYDYVAKVAPKKKETITVTIDGAKAKVGPLNENLDVTSKESPGAVTTIGVRAEIK